LRIRIRLDKKLFAESGSVMTLEFRSRSGLSSEKNSSTTPSYVESDIFQSRKKATKVKKKFYHKKKYRWIRNRNDVKCNARYGSEVEWQVKFGSEINSSGE